MFECGSCDKEIDPEECCYCEACMNAERNRAATARFWQKRVREIDVQGHTEPTKAKREMDAVIQAIANAKLRGAK